MEHVLLTGFPGFLAERLVRETEAGGRACTWHLLVFPAELDRAYRLLAELDLPPDRYRVYAADLRATRLGLSAAECAALQGVVTRCFHLAALYDLTADTATSYAANVTGTAQLIDLLLGCPQLRRFNYVSTCYVAGTQRGEIAEDDLPTPAGFHNAYEATKHGAERVVRAHRDRLPTTIFRPAVVIGDSRTGATQKFDGPYVLMVFLRRIHRWLWALPNLGFDDTAFNAVPVDWVGRVLCAVGFSEEHNGETLQLADPHPPTTAEVFDTIAHRVGGRHPWGLPAIARRVVLRLLQCFPLNLLTGIPAATIAYFFHGGRFATARLEAACARHGIALPEWRVVYPACIDFAIRWDRPLLNAGLLRQFNRWCRVFQWIYAGLALAFALVPAWVVGLLTQWDAPELAARLQQDHPLWRPIAVSFLVGLAFVTAGLRATPHARVLHRFMIAVKTSSTLLFLGLAAQYQSNALLLSAVADGSIAVMHMLFALQLARCAATGPARRRLRITARLLPRGFLRAFCAGLAPAPLTATEAAACVEHVIAHVQVLPWTLRWGFLIGAYYLQWLPLCFGTWPFSWLSPPRRQRVLARWQRISHWMVRLPLYGLRAVCGMYVYKQATAQRAVGYP